MATRRKVEVYILEKPYAVLSDESESVKELAEFVDSRMREAIEMGHAQNTEKAAVLAALNIAEALFKCRKNLDSLQDSVENRSRALLELIPDK